MKVFNGLLFLTLLIITLLGCQKEKEGYFEITTSVGGFNYTNQTTDPNDHMEFLENPTGYLKLNFMKTRKESYYMEVRPTADSSVYVDVTLKVYYQGELIKTESNGGYNQPVVIAAGNLND
ncbi:MAG: hypothetical protein IPO32_03095 [Crocinitomicaceae bacterium]|nr:hypothetical protein [Crocinitomicaceae bacterium]